MKTKKTLTLFMSVFSILALSLNVFSAGPGMFQNASRPVPGAGANPTLEMFNPAFQKCGKNYVETKMDAYPFGSDLDVIEFWACKLKEGFYNPADLCQTEAGGGKTTKNVINANNYSCSFEEKTSAPEAQCLEGFHPVDLQERTEQRQQVVYSQICSYLNGKLVECHPTPYPQNYNVYYSKFSCVRDGAKFPDQSYNGDQESCHPADSWLGVTGSDPTIQVCGYLRRTSAPAPTPSGPPPAQQPLQ